MRLELRDLFGPIPEQVEFLLQLSQIRLWAAGWNIRSLTVQGPDLVFVFPEDTSGVDLFARYPDGAYSGPANGSPSAGEILF